MRLGVGRRRPDPDRAGLVGRRARMADANRTEAGMRHCYQPNDRDASTPPLGVTLTARSSTTVTCDQIVESNTPAATIAPPATRISFGTRCRGRASPTDWMSAWFTRSENDGSCSILENDAGS